MKKYYLIALLGVTSSLCLGQSLGKIPECGSEAVKQSLTCQTSGTTISGLSSLLRATPQAEAKKSVEPLTSEQKKMLDAAREKLRKAQEEFDQVEWQIKIEHGQRGSFCEYSATSVTIWGDFALVDTEPTGGCVSW